MPSRTQLPATLLRIPLTFGANMHHGGETKKMHGYDTYYLYSCESTCYYLANSRAGCINLYPILLLRTVCAWGIRILHLHSTAIPLLPRTSVFQC